jgi:hypothetical protein
MRFTTSRLVAALATTLALLLGAVRAADIPGLPAPTEAKPGTAQGWTVKASGVPLIGATVAIYGTTMAGQNARFEVKTGKDGRYRQRLPEGIYGLRAEYVLRKDGRSYTLALDPTDGVTSKSHDSADGIAKDFVWRISGVRPGATPGEPGTHEEPFKYYGGSMQVSIYQEGFATGQPFPNGSTIIVKLTPEGPLFDGSTGKPVEFRRTFSEQVRSSSYWYPSDIPLGRYTVRLMVEQPGQPAHPLTLKKSLDFNGGYSDAISVDFLPSTSSGSSLPVQITAKP